MKPHKGRIALWYKQDCGTEGYLVCGVFLDHPQFMGEHGHTSLVLSHDEATGEIETRNSRYTLVKPMTSTLR
jgi:hypothetical protein